MIQWKQLPYHGFDWHTVHSGWRNNAFWLFWVHTCADLSVPDSPSCAQHAPRSSCMLKIPFLPLNKSRPDGWWHGNTQITQSSSWIIKVIIVTTPRGRRRKSTKRVRPIYQMCIKRLCGCYGCVKPNMGLCGWGEVLSWCYMWMDV